jgi:TetR/AcrR family transcriptional repressor of nem operon
MARYTNEQKARTRRKIVDESVRALRGGGVSAVRIHKIMHEAGLTHGGFYAHFDSRDALVADAVSQMSAESEALRRLQRHPGPPGRALSEFLGHYLSMGHCDRAPGACALPIVLPDAGELSPEAREAALGLAARLTDALARRLSDLGRRWPYDLARRLLAEAMGVIIMARAQPTRSARAALLSKARQDLAAAYAVEAEPAAPSTPAPEWEGGLA